MFRMRFLFCFFKQCSCQNRMMGCDCLGPDGLDTNTDEFDLGHISMHNDICVIHPNMTFYVI
jgi:hypothetical protein